MDKKNIDADLAHSLVALKRATLRAREIAERTGTPLITYRNGHVHKNMIIREKSDAEYQ